MTMTNHLLSIRRPGDTAAATRGATYSTPGHMHPAFGRWNWGRCSSPHLGYGGVNGGNADRGNGQVTGADDAEDAITTAAAAENSSRGAGDDAYDDDDEDDDGSVASKILGCGGGAAMLTKSISSPSLLSAAAADARSNNHVNSIITTSSCKETVRETPYQKILKLKKMKLHQCAEEIGSESSSSDYISSFGSSDTITIHRSEASSTVVATAAADLHHGPNDTTSFSTVASVPPPCDASSQHLPLPPPTIAAAGGLSRSFMTSVKSAPNLCDLPTHPFPAPDNRPGPDATERKGDGGRRSFALPLPPLDSVSSQPALLSPPPDFESFSAAPPDYPSSSGAPPPSPPGYGSSWMSPAYLPVGEYGWGSTGRRSWVPPAEYDGIDYSVNPYCLNPCLRSCNSTRPPIPSSPPSSGDTSSLLQPQRRQRQQLRQKSFPPPLLPPPATLHSPLPPPDPSSRSSWPLLRAHRENGRLILRIEGDAAAPENTNEQSNKYQLVQQRGDHVGGAEWCISPDDHLAAPAIDRDSELMSTGKDSPEHQRDSSSKAPGSAEPIDMVGGNERCTNETARDGAAAPIGEITVLKLGDSSSPVDMGSQQHRCGGTASYFGLASDPAQSNRGSSTTVQCGVGGSVQANFSDHVIQEQLLLPSVSLSRQQVHPCSAAISYLSPLESPDHQMSSPIDSITAPEPSPVITMRPPSCAPALENRSHLLLPGIVDHDGPSNGCVQEDESVAIPVAAAFPQIPIVGINQ